MDKLDRGRHIQWAQITQVLMVTQQNLVCYTCCQLLYIANCYFVAGRTLNCLFYVLDLFQLSKHCFFT